MKLFTPVILLLFLAACTQNRSTLEAARGVEAYVPTYANINSSSPVTIEKLEATTTKNAGKIYAYGNYIFQNDLYEGIHVIDNSNPAQPKKIAFIKIPFNTEMAVRGNYIYANSINNLLVIDVRDPLNPSVVKTLKNAFPLINQKYPPDLGYFVCPDPAKGIVLNWKLQTVESAYCRR